MNSSLFCIRIFNFSITAVEKAMFSPLHHLRQISVIYVWPGLFLGFLFCSIDLFVSLYASTTLLSLYINTRRYHARKTTGKMFHGEFLGLIVELNLMMEMSNKVVCTCDNVDMIQLPRNLRNIERHESFVGKLLENKLQSMV